MVYIRLFIVFSLFGIGFTVKGLSGFAQAIEGSSITWLSILGSMSDLTLGVIGLVVSYRNLKIWMRNIHMKTKKWWQIGLAQYSKSVRMYFFFSLLFLIVRSNFTFHALD